MNKPTIKVGDIIMLKSTAVWKNFGVGLILEVYREYKGGQTLTHVYWLQPKRRITGYPVKDLVKVC